MNQELKKKQWWIRAGRIVAKTVLYTILSFLIILLLLHIGPVQNFLRQKAIVYLEKKLATTVRIGKVHVSFPENIVLDKVYLQDLQKDTLFSGAKITANINLWRLAFKNEVNFERIAIENGTAKIRRDLPDTVFNFQFIVEAFAPKNTNVAGTDSSQIGLRSFELDKMRIIYKDVVSGSDVVAWVDHFDTRLEIFDPASLTFDFPTANFKGIKAKIIQSEPLAVSEPEAKDIIEAKQPVKLKVDFKQANLEDISLDYANDVSAFYTTIELDKLLIESEGIDLPNKKIDIKTLAFENTDAQIRLGKSVAAKIVEKEVEQEVESQLKAGWKLEIEDAALANINFRFDNDNQPRLQNGMDYAHLDVQKLQLQATDLHYNIDSIAGSILNAAFTEQSGFELEELRTDFLYSGHESSLSDLFLRTPGTELKHGAAIRYSSIESLGRDIGNMEVYLDLEESKILVRDILYFAPSLRRTPAFAYPDATWLINSRVTGRISDLHIDALEIAGLRDTRINIAGFVGGLPNLNSLSADLAIENIHTTRRDILLFLPDNVIPSNVTWPANLNLYGHFQGNGQVLNTDLRLLTDLGNITVNGQFSSLGDKNNAQYNARVIAGGLRLQTILQNKDIPQYVSGDFKISGRGLDPKVANSRMEGVIHAAAWNDYVYRNFRFNGRIADHIGNINASMIDPAIHFNLQATANFMDQYPAVRLEGMIDSIKFHKLNLSRERLIYRGGIYADFTETDPDLLDGKLLLVQPLMVYRDQRMQLDTVSLTAGLSDTGRYVRLNSDVVTAALEGEFKLSSLPAIFNESVQPYFELQSGRRIVRNGSYDFTFNAYAVDNPAIKLLFPTLLKMDSITLRSHFSDDYGWWGVVRAPYVEMGPNRVSNIRIDAGTASDGLHVKASMERLLSGKNLRFDNTTLSAIVAENTIDFTLNNRDRGSKEKYNIAGLFRQLENGWYQLSINPDSLILNYDAWNITPNNTLVITKQGINASNFVLSKSGQQLTISSRSLAINAPLELNFSGFRLSTITGFIQPDTTFANGLINGQIAFMDLANDPVFTSDLNVIDFIYQGDTVGNVRVIANNREREIYYTEITLSGRGNDAKLSGNYYPVPGNSHFDLDLVIRSLPVSNVDAFTNGGVTGGSGTLSGRFDVTGSFKRPVIRGDLDFNNTGFHFTMLNSHFTIDGEKIRVTERGLVFDRFEVLDSARNVLMIDGIAATDDFSHYEFNMDISASNFRALNSTKKDNALFYGKLYFDTYLKLRGTETLPVVDGELVVNDQTIMTVVIPQREPGVVERDGIVEFVDMDAPLNDSLFLLSFDTLNISNFKGLDVAVNVEIVRQAEFNIIIDEGNGDFLNVKGEALLTGGIDPSGRVTLSGSYELEEGAYELSFNFARRRFNIQKGSRIVWEGEPTRATLDIEAVYVANAAPLDLVENMIGETTAFERNTYLQKLPFDVHLDMSGPLLRPQISFDIILPERSYVVGGDIITNVRTRLEQVRQEPSEMNKQVFSLLVFNRFMAENPFHSSSGGLHPSTFVRQSVSKLLTEQLNRLAANLIAGVDLDFDIISSEDYTTGERRDRTDLNVKLSKRLLNDRLTVTVGSDFELEGPNRSNYQSSNIVGDLAVDYRISKDNRYLIRAYRKNEYEGIIEGYIIETGVAFIITVDYNRFKELFLSREERRQKRQLKRTIRAVTSDSTRVNTTPIGPSSE